MRSRQSSLDVGDDCTTIGRLPLDLAEDCSPLCRPNEDTEDGDGAPETSQSSQVEAELGS